MHTTHTAPYCCDDECYLESHSSPAEEDVGLITRPAHRLYKEAQVDAKWSDDCNRHACAATCTQDKSPSVMITTRRRDKRDEMAQRCTNVCTWAFSEPPQQLLLVFLCQVPMSGAYTQVQTLNNCRQFLQLLMVSRPGMLPASLTDTA